ncbi:MAG: HTH domain-containing protein, partial [Hungatella sp.]
MKTEILKLLKGQDGYLSGQDLCDHLGVSRTA